MARQRMILAAMNGLRLTRLAERNTTPGKAHLPSGATTIKPKTSKAVGAIIVSRREVAGLSRYALGRKSGVDSTYLMRIERGDVVNVSFTTVCALADALGCTTDELRPT